MKYLFVVALMLAALVTACAPNNGLSAITNAGTQGAFSYTFADTVGGDQPIASVSDFSNITVLNNNGSVNVTVTIYGHNATGTIIETIVNVSNVTKATLNNTFTGVDCITLNNTIVGGVTFANLKTGATLVTFNSSSTLARNPITYNGSNYVCPNTNLPVNSSVVDVGTFSEYSLFLTCAVEKGNSPQISVKYAISPDNLVWFPGAVSLSGCNGTVNSTALTDKGIRYLRLSINNSDSNHNPIYAKLVYK